MTGRSRMSNTDTTKDAHRIGRRGERVCWVAWPNACVAAALASVLFVGRPGVAVAQAEGEVFDGCQLGTDTVAALKGNMGTGFVADGQVAFVVVYTMKDNDGQELLDNDELPSGQFTGPVICTNPTADDVESVFQGVDIESINQEDPIPDGQADAVNTLDAEEVFILRYELVDEGEPTGVVEKVLCHAVNDQIDCFRISPLP